MKRHISKLRRTIKKFLGKGNTAITTHFERPEVNDSKDSSECLNVNDVNKNQNVNAITLIYISRSLNFE